MGFITYTNALTLAHNAGFSNPITIVAIAYAESGLNDLAQHVVNDIPPTDSAYNSVDRGIVQINSFWHAEVPDTCAFTAACAFAAAYTISAQGTNYTPWSTYTSGAYKEFLPVALAARDTWNSTAHFFGNIPLSYTTGIALAWKDRYVNGLHNMPPPTTDEFSTVDWAGRPIIAQMFGSLRCEWNGKATWIVANGGF